LPYLRLSWGGEWGEGGRYFSRAPACLSCLVACGRYDEVLQLIDSAPRVTWHYRRYGVQALAAMGRTDEAVAYAEASRGAYDLAAPIADACEKILLAAGRTEEAYQEWALAASQGGTNLAAFRTIAGKYPHKEPTEILDDLIKRTAGNEGRWFATAKSLKLFELAADLAKRSPCEPKTLNRAARDHLEDNPHFSLPVALASIRWLTEGHGYEVTGADVLSAFSSAVQAAKTLGRSKAARDEIARLLKSDQSPGMFVRQVLQRYMEAPRSAETAVG
jgi:tetratricopeptide (TPR) repeat protein